MFKARRSPKVLVAVDHLTLGGIKILELPARGLFIEVRLGARQPGVELKVGKPVQVSDGITAKLPDEDVCLEVPSGGVLQVDLALAFKLPEGVGFQAPKGSSVVLNDDEMKLPAGTKVIWPDSDSGSPPKYSDAVADDKSLAFWPRKGGELVLQADGRFRFSASG